ncbi:hypothetical protein MTBLM1_40098 [Rhodospirillaceae bacterium LM-1]|nr:hypothetical protein MTBLM1_40098 [Rhodospirillaceae bacterium LM-1]
MSGKQVNIRLTPGEKEEFEAYARGFGLDASELTKLLIVREFRLDRLAENKNCGGLSAAQKRNGGNEKSRLPTITAHYSSAKDVEIFSSHAKQRHMSRGAAGACLLRTELKERWLEKVLPLNYLETFK